MMMREILICDRHILHICDRHILHITRRYGNADLPIVTLTRLMYGLCMHALAPRTCECMYACMLILAYVHVLS